MLRAMADVFVSYVSEDRATAERISLGLEAAGFSVWWDHKIRAGVDFRHEIGRQLEAAKVVVVLWSVASLDSEWVRDEAQQAHDRNKLIPVRLDGAQPPLGFRQTHSLDFNGWNGDPNATVFAGLIDSARFLLGETPDEPTRAPVVIGSQSKARTWGWIVAGGLAAAFAVFVLLRVATPGPAVAPQPPPAATSEAASTTTRISIAVLPFTNLSGDPKQEFFSDGITEEITTALAKMPDLRVVGRTSAYQFKGEGKDLRAIGRSLNATHLIEGSVRKEGDRVRIAAQLIKADDGVHVWAENYDRQLTGVFAIQNEISTAITAALSVPLGLRNREPIVPNRPTNLDAYQDYLRAKALVRDRGVSQVNEAIAMLERVVEREPNYALAWALLALAYAVAPQTPAFFSGDPEAMRAVAVASLARAEPAARRAIALDPNLPDGYVALGRVNASRGELLAADAALAKALELDQTNPDVLQIRGNLLAQVGRLEESLSSMRRLLDLEPFVPTFTANAAGVLWLNGQDDAALSAIERLPVGTTRQVQGSVIYASLGRYRDAAGFLDAIPAGAFLPGTVETAARLLRSAPNKVASSNALPSLGVLSFVYLYVGARDRSLDAYAERVAAGYSEAITTAFLWHPTYAAVRKTERFRDFVRASGLEEYWRARGWPKFCQPTGGDDFVCN